MARITICLRNLKKVEAESERDEIEKESERMNLRWIENYRWRDGSGCQVSPNAPSARKEAGARNVKWGKRVKERM